MRKKFDIFITLILINKLMLYLCNNIFKCEHKVNLKIKKYCLRMYILRSNNNKRKNT